MDLRIMLRSPDFSFLALVFCPGTGTLFLKFPTVLFTEYFPFFEETPIYEWGV
jgi:hypothetical protein